MKRITINLKTLVFAISTILLANACTEDLNIDYKGKTSNKLVVDGIISTDTTAHPVILYRTVENGVDVVYETAANVTISDDNNTYELTEISPGIYITDSSVYGVPGNTYQLHILTSGNVEYVAESKLNTVAEIDSIKFRKEYFPLAGIDFYKIYFFGQEPPEIGQCYIWNLYLNDSLFNDTINETRFEQDEFVNGSYFEYFDIYWLEEKDVSNDTTKVTLEMLSIPAEYNQYLIEVMSETAWRGSPWDPVPANVSTNISNGGAGFFRAVAKTNKTITYIKSIEEKEE